MVYGPPDTLARYTLYPLILGEVLEVQVRVMLCDTGGWTAVAVKFTPTLEAPFIDTEAVDGVKV